MQNLLLPDADVVIGLHELGYWDKLLNCYKIYLASTVVEEVKHYWNPAGEKIPIDLSPQIENGKIIKLDGAPEIQSEILDKLKEAGLDGIDPGELESIAIICGGEIEELKFCIKERLAIKAMAYLDMSEKAISVEQILRDTNLLTKKQNIPGPYSRKRFESIRFEGKSLRVEINSTRTNNKK